MRWLVAALVFGAAAQAEPIAFGPLCPEEYPEEALEAGHEGSVSLVFTITAEGSVAYPSIAVSSGFRELDERALACVRTLHYSPAMHDGKPVAVTWNTEMRYTLPPPGEIPRLEALNHAMGAVRDEAGRCLAASDAAKIVRAEFAGFTRLRIAVPPAGSPAVTLTGSSGNPALEAVAAAIPKERTFAMTVPWEAVLKAQ